MSVLGERLLAVHRALDDADLPHAFGGAIALAYCTAEPRGTRDIDVNVFAEPGRARDVLRALPDGVAFDDDDVRMVERDGQVRVWWQDTPLDLFFDVHDFHAEAAAGVREVPFLGTGIPVLGCFALVVFKALYGRTRDWADIEDVVEIGAVDCREALSRLRHLLGDDHPSAVRLAEICEPPAVSDGR